MKELLDGLKPFQKVEFVLMLLLAAVIPFHWFAAQCCEVALLVCAVLKVCFEQKFTLNKEQLRYKWVYIIFAMTWVVYLVGMIYTENQSFGWAQVSKKLGFLIFPAIFLFSDMSYLTKERYKAIGYALVAGCILFFFMNLSYAVYDVIFNGETSARFFDEQLMKIYYVHHSYLSMYAALGLMFCFYEIFENDNRKVKIINILAYITLVVFIILVRSRAGLIWMVLTFLLQWISLTFIMKKKRIGLIMGSVFVLAVAGACIAFPQSVSRITVTIKDINSEHHSDHRLVQFKGYKPVLKENWLWGVGTGDRTVVTQEAYHAYKAELTEIIGKKMSREIDWKIGGQYYEPSESMRKDLMKKAKKHGCDPDVVNKYLVDYLYINYAIDKEINAHNVFFETLISVGVIGLLFLLSYFVIPIVLWIRQKRFDMLYFSFIMMIGFNGLFESVFEVQKGIIFFCFFNVLLFRQAFINENQKN